MEPLIKNKNTESPARLVFLDENPSTCTLTYSQFEHGETSPHHIHEWEHEVYILPVKEPYIAMELNILFKQVTVYLSRLMLITTQ